MTAAGEISLEEEPHHARGLLGFNEPAAEAEHVRIVVFARESGRLLIPTKSRARAWYLVRGYRYADTRTANQHPALDFSGSHGLRYSGAEIRIVNAIQVVSAFIDDFNSERRQLVLSFFFGVESGMVAANGNLYWFHCFLP